MQPKLRPIKEDDWQSIQKHTNCQDLAKWMRDSFQVPLSDLDAKTWAKICSEHPETYFGIDIDGEIVGVISIIRQLDVHQLCAEVGYWIGQEYWNKGIMTSMIEKAICMFSIDHPDIRKLFAEVFEGNDASCRVLEKLGFSREATLKNHVYKNGKILDMYVYSNFGF